MNSQIRSAKPLPNELKAIREQYINDPRRVALLRQKAHIMEVAVYDKAIIGNDGLKVVYHPNIQRNLDALDDHLKDIEREYTARLMNI